MTPHERLAPEHGQTMAEYALVVGLITLGVIVVLTALSGSISDAIRIPLKLLP